MSYTAKTNWKNGDKLPASDLNRIEQGVLDAHTIAESKVDATQVQQAVENATASKIDASQAQDLIDSSIADLAKQTYVDTQIDTKLSEYAQEAGTELDGVKNDIADNTQRIESLENTSGLELKTINGETLTGTGDIALPSVADVEAIDTDLQAYKGVVDPQLATITTDLSNLNTEVDTLTTEVESQEVDISNLDARVTTLEQVDHADEKVKMTADGTADYLQAMLDGVTIVNNNGKLTVENLNGLLVTKEDLNQLAGVKENIQGQIDSLSSVGSFKGAVNNLNELYNISPAPKVGDYYIVLEDSDHGDVSTIYMFSENGFQFLGEFTVEIRDFETDPLNLETEATGVLPIEHIPTGTTAETVATGDHTHAEATTAAAGFMSTADKTKLNAIATGATKNDTDANLRDRSTHTGSQSFATLNDVAAEAQIPVLDVNTKTTGVLNLDRLPTGTTAGTVALGDHTHNVATTALNGFMAATDKMRLESLQGIKPLTVDLFPTTNPELAAFQEYLMKNLQLAGIFDYNPSQMLDDSFSVWYDPNDLTTLYQDQHGLTPVTEVGQPVGLWLDKSRGLKTQVVFDLTEQAIDDVFDPANAGSTITDSTITITSAGGVIGWFDELGGKIGKIRAKGNASKPVRIRNGSTAQGAYILPTGDFDIDIYTGAMFAYRDSGLYFSAETTVSATDPCVLRFDELVVTAIDSVPAIQATESARPTLGYNAVTKSNFLKFDGVRSCMNVGRIDLSNTQQVTIMHAARKMSPSTAAMVFELTAKATAEGALTYGVNTATGVGVANETTWFMSLADTGQGEMIGAAVGYPSPDARVSIMQWDKSKTTQTEQMRLWLDNEPQTLFFNDEAKIGAGSFAKLEAYFGTRGQYGNQFMFNGEFYEFILMGRLATEDEITSTYSRLRKQITV